MKKLRCFGTLALLITLFCAPVLRAQTPAEMPGAASPSVMSGQSSEPEARGKEDPAEALKKPSPSVTKLGGMVGMKPETASMAFQWLNFLVLALGVGYFLIKSLPKAFRGRTENIQKNIVEARVATEEARVRLSAVEERLGKLDGEIAALKAENDKAAADEEARIHAQLEDEKKRVIEAAEQEIAAASNAANRSLRAYAAEIAVDRAAAQLQITADDDRVLIESFASKLTTEGSRN
jgi:F-type H+-transporting ATPase subunit b